MKGKRGRWMEGRFLRACQGTFFFTFSFAFGQSPFTLVREEAETQGGRLAQGEGRVLLRGVSVLSS